MTWKEKTCEKCVFRVGDECRRFPPNDTGDTTSAFYPVIRYRGSSNYIKACAEYAEPLDINEGLRSATISIDGTFTPIAGKDEI